MPLVLHPLFLTPLILHILFSTLLDLTALVLSPLVLLPLAKPWRKRMQRGKRKTREGQRAKKEQGESVGVVFTRQMSDTATDPNGYRLHPAGETPTSAVRDQGSYRILLTFPSPIAEALTHTLDILRARDLSGALIDPTFRSVTFTPGATAAATRADFDSDGVVGFGDFLLFSAAFGGQDTVFDLDTDGLVGFSDFLIFASLFGQVV